MKQTIRGRVRLAVGLLVACGAVAGAVQAQNPMSPTMRQAALLKDFPPVGWIRHYLPDDRYKIVGNVWAVVSTNTDTYYHRPDCPNMLRQPADNVLGFASSADARDAGYLPDPLCNPDAPAALHFGPNGRPIVSTKAMRVTLSDGGSSLVVPAGWMRLPGSRQNMMGNSMTMDMLRPATGSDAVTVVTMILPSREIAAQVVDPARAPQLFSNVAQMMSSRAATDANAARAQEMFASIQTHPGTLSGLHGVTLTMKSSVFMPGVSGGIEGVMVARGQKIYMVSIVGHPAGASEILNSFQAR